MATQAPSIHPQAAGTIDQPDPVTDGIADNQPSSAPRDSVGAYPPSADSDVSSEASNKATGDDAEPPQQPVPSPDQPAPVSPAEPDRAVPPRVNLGMRVLSRMQLDLDILTGGTRPATYEEVDEAFLHAIRAVAPERLHEFTAVAEPASESFVPNDRVSSGAVPADQDAGSNENGVTPGDHPADAATDPATRQFTRVDLGSPQAAAQFQPAVFNRDQHPGDNSGVEGIADSFPDDGARHLSVISQQDGGFPNPFSGMGDAFVRALVERREKLARELQDIPSNVANAAANSMRGSQARDLTPAEYQMVSDAFPGMIDLSNVKIVLGPGRNPDAFAAFKYGGNPAFTEGNTIYINPDAKFPTGARLYSPDLSSSPDRIETLIHEFNHVLQYQRLGFTKFFLKYGNDQRKYGLYKYGFDRDIVYHYEKRKSEYATETLEGQSQIAGDYARLRALNAPSTLSKRRDLEQRMRGTGIYGF